MSIDFNDPSFYGENENLRKERAESVKTNEQWTDGQENGFVKFLRKALAADAAIKLGIVGGAPLKGAALTGGATYGYIKALRDLDALKQSQTQGKSKAGSILPEDANAGTTSPDELQGKSKAGSNLPKDVKAEEDSDEYVTFTLPRANDPEYGGFAQKILDLGIATDKGLWGADGDVAFYTQQLYDQGALDDNGNLKIGVPIRLRRRK